MFVLLFQKCTRIWVIHIVILDHTSVINCIVSLENFAVCLKYINRHHKFILILKAGMCRLIKGIFVTAVGKALYL